MYLQTIVLLEACCDLHLSKLMCAVYTNPQEVPGTLEACCDLHLSKLMCGVYTNPQEVPGMLENLTAKLRL